MVNVYLAWLPRAKKHLALTGWKEVDEDVID